MIDFKSCDKEFIDIWNTSSLMQTKHYLLPEQLRTTTIIGEWSSCSQRGCITKPSGCIQVNLFEISFEYATHKIRWCWTKQSRMQTKNIVSVGYLSVRCGAHTYLEETFSIHLHLSKIKNIFLSQILGFSQIHFIYDLNT